MNERVEIFLGKDGSVKVEAMDFEGKSCEDATSFLEDLFGEPVNKEFKSEYFKTNANILPCGYCG